MKAPYVFCQVVSAYGPTVTIHVTANDGDQDGSRYLKWQPKDYTEAIVLLHQDKRTGKYFAKGNGPMDRDLCERLRALVPLALTDARTESMKTMDDLIGLTFSVDWDDVEAAMEDAKPGSDDDIPF